MSADLAVTRRRKMLAFLVEQGGSAGLAEANQYSETKLLAAHQAFSAIMEGLVDGGYITWDGTTFVVTAAGKEEAALAPKPRARKGAKAAADVTVAPTAAVEATPAAGAHDHGHSHDHGRDEAQEHGHRHDHGRDEAQDHGHSHDHGRDEAQDHGHRHDHGGGAAPRSTTTTPPPRPRPTVEPPRRGLRARALGLIRRLFAK